MRVSSIGCLHLQVYAFPDRDVRSTASSVAHWQTVGADDMNILESRNSREANAGGRFRPLCSNSGLGQMTPGVSRGPRSHISLTLFLNVLGRIRSCEILGQSVQVSKILFMMSFLARNIWLLVALLLSVAHSNLAIAQTAYWRIESAIKSPGHEIPLVDKNGHQHGAINQQWAKELVEIKIRIANAANADAELVLVEGNRPNAFAGAAGGRRIVGINLGMLALLGQDRDAVAAILGHEIGHHVKQHGETTATRSAVIDIASSILGAWLNAKGLRFGDSLATLAGTMLDRSYSRDQEREADELGLGYMSGAGFDRNGALRLHSKLLAALPDGPLPFLNTHPGGQERIANIQRFIAAMPSGATIASVAPRSTVSTAGEPLKIEPTVPALAAAAADTKVIQRQVLDSVQIYREGLEKPSIVNATISPTFVILSRGGWAVEDTLSGTKRALSILAQCGIYADRIDIVLIDAPDDLSSFSDARAKALLRQLSVSRPAVFFVKENRQPKKFEFEVVAEGNSRTRPELRNTVWIVRHARDVGEGLARMFMYMFMNNYELSNTPGSLFFSDHTSYENASINADQCSRAVKGANQVGLAK